MTKGHFIATTLILMCILLLVIPTGCTPGETASTTATATTASTFTATTTSSAPVTTTFTAVTATPGITLQDQLGRTITLDQMPETIISLAPSNTEILFALGLGDRVIGVTEYCNYPEEALEKQSIGGFSTPDIEQIIALAPDVVFADDIHLAEIIPALEGYGITVIGIDPATLDEVLEAIDIVGRVTGVTGVSDALIADMRGRIQAITDVTSSISAEELTRVAYVVWHEPLMVSGGGTIHDEIISACGGINIAADMDSYATISLESMMGADPQVLIAGVGMGEGQDLVLQYLQDEPRLEGTTARQNNAVYPIASDMVDRTGPRIVAAMEQFAAFIHPELFGE